MSNNNIPAFQVVDRQANIIRAAANFEYKGFEISFTTISQFPEICIYKDNKYVEDFGCKEASAINFRAAMDYIDSITS